MRNLLLNRSYENLLSKPCLLENLRLLLLNVTIERVYFETPCELSCNYDNFQTPRKLQHRTCIIHDFPLLLQFCPISHVSKQNSPSAHQYLVLRLSQPKFYIHPSLISSCSRKYFCVYGWSQESRTAILIKFILYYTY